MPKTHPAISAREALFAVRVGKLLGLDDTVGIAHATVDEFPGRSPVLTVEVVRALTPEEALRLRYGDDAIIEPTENGGWTVRFPDP